MTDRYNALVVTLERDIRDDDAEHIIQAIQMIKGVLSAEGNVADMSSHVAESRVRQDLGKKIWAILFPEAAERIGG